MNLPVRVWITVTGLVVLHLFLHIGLGIGGGAPDLLTLALLIAAREMRVGPAAGAGLLFGLMEDALSSLAFGANSVAMTAVGILGSVTREFFVGDSRLFLISYLWLGKWIRDLLHWFFSGEGARGAFFEVVIAQGVLAATYMTVVGTVALIAAGSWKEELRI